MSKPNAWIAFGLGYCVTYAVLVSLLGANAQAYLLVGNIGLLVPPLAALVAVLRRRREWLGCHVVFWDAIAGWAALWLIGQIGFSVDEVVLGQPRPWFGWHTLLQLTAGALPLIALLARPHRGLRQESATTTAIDVWILDVVLGFMCWSVIMAPAAVPAHAEWALQALSIDGSLIRLAAMVGLLWAAYEARGTPWRVVYQRLGVGMGVAFALLVPHSSTVVRATYHTQLLLDVGRMLPFWFAAWAATAAPVSEREHLGYAGDAAGLAPATLLFGTLITVPIVGFGLRYLQPLGDPIDRRREIATSLALIVGLGFTMLRITVERRALGRAAGRIRVLAAAFEQTEDLVFIARERSIRYANDAFCRATGYSRQEIEALSPADLVAPASRGEVAPMLDKVKRREVVRTTLTLARKDGSTFQASYATTPIIDREGGVTHYVSVIRDITEDLALREQLVRGERMSAVGELISGVVHELDEPLRSALGALGRALDDPTAGNLRAELERAHGEAVRIDAIVQNLRAFIRTAPAERLVADLNDIVSSTVALRSYELSAAEVDLRVDYGRVPLVYVNREEIQQVLLNLLINAQYSIAKADGRGVLMVRTSSSGADALVDIIDDGPGIPAWAEGRVFEPFFTTKDAGEGTGLGLSTAFGIATAHGGTLALVPSASGAWFRLTLPGAGFPGPVHAG